MPHIWCHDFTITPVDSQYPYLHTELIFSSQGLMTTEIIGALGTRTPISASHARCSGSSYVRCTNNFTPTYSGSWRRSTRKVTFQRKVISRHICSVGVVTTPHNGVSNQLCLLRLIVVSLAYILHDTDRPIQKCKGIQGNGFPAQSIEQLAFLLLKSI